VCFHRIEFERLPNAERQAQIVAIVHERYANATMDDLPAAYKAQLLAAPDTDSIYIWGPTGTGKTYALAALARHWLETGWRVERSTWERLCLRIRDTFKPQARETEWSIIEPLLSVDKLILEDVGTTVSVGRQETDFSLRVLWLILDSRSEDCLQTAMTGNKPIEELARSFDARIASRLRQGAIIHKTGQDKREKVTKEREQLNSTQLNYARARNSSPPESPGDSGKPRNEQEKMPL